ncbi:MAG: RecX family transcriptional regulator [Candidatus Zhuqueibacterota bacterium]
MVTKKITQIVIQQKRKNRCSIFLDDEFAFGLNEDVVFQYGLKKGDELTEKQVEEILVSEEKKAAKERALNLLSFRDRSEKELRTKLKQAGFQEANVDSAIDELKRLRFIDDRKFAMNFAQSKMMAKPLGEFLLRRELKQKGIDEEIIEQVIENIFGETDQVALALRIAGQKLRQIKNLDETKKKRRVSDLLLRRGFNWDVVSQVLDQWDDLGATDEGPDANGG